jgi:hypothetical protein
MGRTPVIKLAARNIRTPLAPVYAHARLGLDPTPAYRDITPWQDERAGDIRCLSRCPPWRCSCHPARAVMPGGTGWHLHSRDRGQDPGWGAATPLPHTSRSAFFDPAEAKQSWHTSQALRDDRSRSISISCWPHRAGVEAFAEVLEISWMPTPDRIRSAPSAPGPMGRNYPFAQYPPLPNWVIVADVPRRAGRQDGSCRGMPGVTSRDQRPIPASRGGR